MLNRSVATVPELELGNGETWAMDDDDMAAQTIREGMLASLRAQRQRTKRMLVGGELDESLRAHLERMMEFTGRYVED